MRSIEAKAIDIYRLFKKVTYGDRVPYADGDCVKLTINVGRDLLEVDNIILNKRYGTKGEVGKFYKVKGYSLLRSFVAEDKVLVNFLKDKEVVHIYCTVCSSEMLLDRGNSNSAYLKIDLPEDAYILKPKEDIYKDLDSYRLNIINNGGRYSLGMQDIASYLVPEIQGVAKELNTDIFTMQENIITGKEHIFLTPINGSAISFSKEELENCLKEDFKNSKGLKYRVVELLLKMSNLPNSDKVNTFKIEGIDKMYKAGYWNPSRSRIVELQVWKAVADMEEVRRG